MQAVAFDPYHVWLGIPPREQPPNHYRLLGIALYESSADVIATAADRQMAHLRSFQSGPRSQFSQKLLNEVAAAKVCLLSPAKKAAYDAQLRRQLVPAEDSKPAPADSSPWAQPVAVQDATPASSQWITESALPAARTRYAARKRQTSLGPVIAVAIGGGLLLVGVLAWNATRQADKAPGRVAVAEKQGEQTIVRPGKSDSPPVRAEPDTPPSPPEDPRAETATLSQPIAPDPPERSADAEPAAPFTRPIFEKPTEAVEKSAVPSFDFSGDKPPDKPAEPPKPKKRLPAPDEAAQQRIAAQIGGIYNPARAKTAAEKSKLAYQLLQAAKGSKNQDERYVLLRQGRELAGQAGELALALQAIEMAAEFDIDPLEEKTATLLAFAEKAQSADQIRALYGGSQQVIGQALAEARYKAASDLAGAVCRACQRAHGKEFRKKALDQREWVTEFCQREEQRQEAEARLKTDPNDAGAHLMLGCCYCLEDDWKNALPHFAKGSDGELRQLAERELAPPTGPSEQMKLADAWWALAQARQGEQRDSWLLRAGYWYDRARAKLSSGLERLKAEKRLEELVEVRQRRAADRRQFPSGKGSAEDLWNDIFEE